MSTGDAVTAVPADEGLVEAGSAPRLDDAEVFRAIYPALHHMVQRLVLPLAGRVQRLGKHRPRGR